MLIQALVIHLILKLLFCVNHQHLMVVVFGCSPLVNLYQKKICMARKESAIIQLFLCQQKGQNQQLKNLQGGYSQMHHRRLASRQIFTFKPFSRCILAILIVFKCSYYLVKFFKTI